MMSFDQALMILHVRVMPVLQPMAISSSLLSAGVQLLVSGAFATMLVQLLLVRQNRRKIDGEASVSESSAATQLSGTALTMLTKANEDADSARKALNEARGETTRIWNELSTSRAKEQTQAIEISILKAALRAAGIEIPEMPDDIVAKPKLISPDELPPAFTD